MKDNETISLEPHDQVGAVAPGAGKSLPPVGSNAGVADKTTKLVALGHPDQTIELSEIKVGPVVDAYYEPPHGDNRDDASAVKSIDGKSLIPANTTTVNPPPKNQAP